MPINFPNSPSPSQLYSYDNKTWEWNGTYWEVYSALTSYITSAYTVGDGFSDISGVTGGNIALKSFSGVNLTIIDNGEKLTFSAASQPGVVLSYYVSGSTPSGVTLNSGDRWLDTTTGDELVYVNDGDSAQWIQICCGGSGGGGGSSTIQGITGITGTSGVSATTTDYGTTIINTSPDQTVTITGGTNIGVTGTYPNFGVSFTGTTGSNFTGGTVTGATNFTNGLTANTISASTYQNLPSFNFAQINGITQFSAGTNNFINFSGINITITSAATNTLVFSAGTGSSSGVTQITAGNGISISPTGGTGNVTIDATTLIASSSLVIVPDSSIYIGGSTYGWNDRTWDLNDTSFALSNVNCGIPLPINVEGGKTINICGIAYLNGSGDTTKCDFGVYLYKFDCADVGRVGIQMVASGVTVEAFNSSGLYCFNLSYTLPKLSPFSACTDFLTIGFSSDSAIDSTESRITFTINAS